MTTTTLTIAYETGAGTKNAKTRAFRAELLAHVCADALWEVGAPPDHGARPALAVFAATEHALKAFEANLRDGRPALGEARGSRDRPWRLELLRSAGYQYARQRYPALGAAAVTAHLPRLFEVDPGLVDPAGVRCVVLPPAATLAAALPAAEAARAAARVAALGARVFGRDVAAPSRAALAELAPLAELAAAYLYPRTTRPLPPDPAWRLQLLCALLAAGLASRHVEDPNRYSSYWKERAPWDQRADWRYAEAGVAALGFAPGVAICATHEEFNGVYATQVALWHRGAVAAAARAAS